jgi:hypothetical protein
MEVRVRSYSAVTFCGGWTMGCSEKRRCLSRYFDFHLD